MKLLRVAFFATLLFTVGGVVYALSHIKKCPYEKSNHEYCLDHDARS
jgi:hypothetical protein